MALRGFAVVFCAVVLALGAASAADLSGPIRQILVEGNRANFDMRDLDLPDLQEFYAARQFQPAWTGSADAERNARIALEALSHAEDEGLQPDRYHLHEIALRQHAATVEAEAQYDLMLTGGLLRFIADGREGQPDLRALDRDVELPPQDFDVPHALLDALNTGRLAELLTTLDPPDAAFARLKQALARYRRIAAQGDWPQIWDGVPDLAKISAQQAELLRRRLSFEDARVAADPAMNLVTAVEDFQSRHGIEADGRVGKRTLQELNIPASARADQIAANMERWRWLPRDLGRRYVMVNAADTTLIAVDDGQIVLRSKIIAGKPGNRTAIFAAKITGITFNPSWNIPAPIARNEILPKARRNPNYLAHNHIVFDPDGTLRQLPGSDNALGYLKLEMQNRFTEYLHDTSTRSLFARTERHLSHGCMRVEQIRPLASFAMTGDPASGLDKIAAEISDGATKRILLDNPMPVFVLYWTAIAQADGSVDFVPDVYGRDQRLLAAVAGRPAFGRVTMNTVGGCQAG